MLIKIFIKFDWYVVNVYFIYDWQVEYTKL